MAKKKHYCCVQCGRDYDDLHATVKVLTEVVGKLMALSLTNAMLTSKTFKKIPKIQVGKRK